MNEQKKYCLSDEGIRIIVAKAWSAATGDEVSPYHVDITPARAVAAAEHEATENYLRHEKGWCTSLELSGAVQQTEQEVAKEIFDRLEDNLFYMSSGNDISISFTVIGWKVFKAKYLKPAPAEKAQEISVIPQEDKGFKTERCFETAPQYICPKWKECKRGCYPRSNVPHPKTEQCDNACLIGDAGPCVLVPKETKNDS